MSEVAQEVNFDAPVKPAKKTKAKKKAAAKIVKSALPFPGLTRSACADSCGAKGCAIGTAYCAHPCKGGLQSADKNDPVKLKAIQTAMAQIDVRLDPRRFQGD